MRSAGSSRSLGSAIGSRHYRLAFQHPVPPDRLIRHGMLSIIRQTMAAVRQGN
jgi:hypothetical protein